jgi:uncharacterized membrane protein YdjX (TVP38/TMEM64 family)
MTKPLRIAVWTAAVATVLGGALLLPLGGWAAQLVEWIRGAGAPGVVVFALVYVAATMLVLPGSALTLGAGFAYGPLWGAILVSPVSVLAATGAFLLGRTIARGWIARRVAKDTRFRAVDRAVARSGFKIVLLLRLSPIFPFSVMNYALALTSVRLRDYVVASFIGMLPGTVLYVYLGSLVTSASQLAGGHVAASGPWQKILYWGGLAATIVVTVLITRIARRTLERSLDDSPQAPGLGEVHP